MRVLRLWTLVLVFVASCSSTEGKNVDPGTNADPNNANADPNNGQNNAMCACAWEGPVNFALSHVSETPDAIYVQAELTWQPCCAASSSSDRIWVIDWEGTSDISPAIPTSATPVQLPATEEEPVVVAAPAGGVELRIVQIASDSVSATALDIGDLVAPAGDGEEVIAEIMVALSE